MTWWAVATSCQPSTVVFFVFQILIDVEKVDDLFEDVGGQVRQVLNAFEARVGGGDGQNLLVRPFLVPHHQDPEGPGGDEAAGGRSAGW